jgi:8-oxo-dGTP pyrophosphatase MutT (NUDIX family)
LEEFADKLRSRLEQPLPGEEHQFRMAPFNRERTDPSTLKTGEFTHSAVMALICEDASGTFFIPLIQRMAYDGVHSAQVSFPGGKQEQGDNDLQATALRECYEEIGLKDSIEIIGSLTKLYIPVSRLLVNPFVGICRLKDPQFVPHVREVQNILKLRVRELVAGSIEKDGQVIQNEFRINTRFFDLEGRQVWGATAMILSELKEVMRGVL